MRSMRVARAAIVAAVVAVSLAPVPVRAAPNTAGSSWTSAAIALPNGAVAYDHVRDELLVAVSPESSALGNQLVEIDPHTGAIGRSVVVGSSPSVIAVADDASLAYVGSTGTPGVLEIDLSTFTVVRTIDLGGDTSGPFYALEIEVEPGAPEVIAVSRESRCCAFGHEGVAIYESGVRRPVEVSGFSYAHQITWGDDPSVLYAYDDMTSSHWFFELAVDVDGVSIARQTPDLIDGYDVDIEYASGLVYASNGQVIDPATRSEVGVLDVTGPLAVDVAEDAVFVHSDDAITRIDAGTFVTDWTSPVLGGPVRGLVDAGEVLVAARGAGLTLHGEAVTSSGFSPPDGPETVLDMVYARRFPQPVWELAVSPDQQRLYGVVPSAAPEHPNEVVEIDPATGAVVRSLFVGGEPHRLAISADGSTLLVAQFEENQLVEVDVADLVVRSTIALPPDTVGHDVKARPGAAATFAVILEDRSSVTMDGTILVTDGVIAPEVGDPRHGTPSAITFAGDPNRVYGYDSKTSTAGDFTRFEVDATGVSVLDQHPRFFRKASQTELVSAGGRVFASSGALVDPVLPALIGTFDAVGQPVPIVARDRMLLIRRSTISEFELSSFARIGEETFVGDDAVDAVLVGDQVAIATESELLLVPVHDPPTAIPGAPGHPVGAVGDRRVTVFWQPPPADPAAAVGQYRVVASPGGQVCTTPFTSCTVTGLENGTVYTFTVVAMNSQGTGPPSSPTIPLVPIGPPTEPTAVDLVVSPGTIDISWAPPLDDGASPVTSYEALVSPGDHTCSTVDTSCTIGGLVDGISYEVNVRAWNAAGPGTWSPPAGPVVPTGCGGDGAGPFTDVGTAHPFCGDVEWMSAHEIAAGYDDGGFHPAQSVSRQAIAAFVHRMEGRPIVAAPWFQRFTDVPVSSPFYPAIEWVAASGLTNGYLDGSFQPSGPVTRQAMAAILYRLAGSPVLDPPDAPSFSDVPASHPFATAIEWLASVGVVDGYPDGSFGPSRPITRQAAAAILHRDAALG